MVTLSLNQVICTIKDRSSLKFHILLMDQIPMRHGLVGYIKLKAIMSSNSGLLRSNNLQMELVKVIRQECDSSQFGKKCVSDLKKKSLHMSHASSIQLRSFAKQLAVATDIHIKRIAPNINYGNNYHFTLTAKANISF